MAHVSRHVTRKSATGPARGRSRSSATVKGAKGRAAKGGGKVRKKK